MNGTQGLRVGRLFGIDLTIDYSWLFIFVLMAWNLTAAFTHWHPDWSMAVSLGIGVLAALLFFASVVLHELAHSLVARWYGVPVRRITLFLFGGVSNIEREPPSAGAEFATAVVGPLTSIALGIALLFIGGLLVGASTEGYADPRTIASQLGPGESLLMWLGPINIIVGIFNLIPAFPLDGGRILRSILWAATKSLHTATRWASGIGQGIGWLFIVTGIAMAFGANVPFFGRGLVGGLWLAFIGWFVNAAAAQSYRRLLTHEVVEGIPVSRLMRTSQPSLRADLDVATLVTDIFMRSEERSFPVFDEERFVGIVSLSDVRKAPREAWTHTRVADIMTPFDQLVMTTPNEGLDVALDKLAQVDVSQLPVVVEGRFVGLLMRRDIARWLELQMRAPMRRTYAQ
jgi:Zn-dependent protease